MKPNGSSGPKKELDCLVCDMRIHIIGMLLALNRSLLGTPHVYASRELYSDKQRKFQ